MDVNRIEQLLLEVQAGQITVAQALEQLRGLPYEDIGHTRLDMHRALRQGLPEVVFCENKTVEQIVAILQRLGRHHDRVLATRASAEKAEAVQAKVPHTRYDATSRLLTLVRRDLDPPLEDAPALSTGRQWRHF